MMLSREESERMPLTSLCDKLLSKLLKAGYHEYNLAGSTDLMRRFRDKKVLIVLDDVDSFDQLDKLCEACNYVGPDSKLIITTRERPLLQGKTSSKGIQGSLKKGSELCKGSSISFKSSGF